MKDLLQEQRNEVQRSVISQGEYRFKEEFNVMLLTKQNGLLLMMTSENDE